MLLAAIGIVGYAIVAFYFRIGLSTWLGSAALAAIILANVAVALSRRFADAAPWILLETSVCFLFSLAILPTLPVRVGQWIWGVCGVHYGVLGVEELTRDPTAVLINTVASIVLVGAILRTLVRPRYAEPPTRPAGPRHTPFDPPA